MARLEMIPGLPDPRDRINARPRVLLLTHRVPCPPDRGDRIRAYHLLRELSKWARVTVAAVNDEPLTDLQRTKLAELTERSLVQPVGRWAMRRGAASALLTGQPLTPGALYHRGLARALVQAHREQPFDTIVTFCSGMLRYTAPLLAVAPTRHILDLVDVDSAKWSRFAAQARGPRRWVYATEARRLRQAEAGKLVSFDALTVISDRERQTYLQSVTREIDPIVAGNGVDLRHFVPADQLDERERKPIIVFTGVLSYRPNIDAVARFARLVMPQVLEKVPEARFDIVGKSPTTEVYALESWPGVRVVGPVADTAVNLRAAAVVVAPLRIAPGVQNKVLEAMACGRPVVCSPAAAAGIDALPEDELLVAEDDDDTAKRVVELLNSPARRERIGAAARRCVQDRYDWPARLAPLMDLILLGRAPASPLRVTQAQPAQPVRIAVST